ncbi:MAG: hypothetical protein JOZ33_11885, partial [Acidobacteriaceae bacterium]|nr:hypothetical protein [Acidobacteriaceae bacterium]
TRRCNAIALRGHSLCRHHFNRRPQQDQLEVRLARYRRELDAMDLPRLLNALLDKLDLIRAVIPAYPEAQLILAVAANRLGIIMNNHFDDAPETSCHPDPLSLLSPDELEKFADSQAQAAAWIQRTGRA